MIGHFVNTLTRGQEDRILTIPMYPGAYRPTTKQEGPCLIGVVGCWDSDRLRDRGIPEDEFRKAFDYPRTLLAWRRVTRIVPITYHEGESIEERFDDLCDRFGTARVTAAIRQRVLRNRAWRELRSVRQAQSARQKTA